MGRFFAWVLVSWYCCPWTLGQVLSRRPAPGSRPVAKPALPNSFSTTLALSVPAGTALKVTLDKKLRIKEVGQPVHAKLAEPVYAFDKLVVPAGSEVLGRVTEIDAVSKKTRILNAMNSDFLHRTQCKSPSPNCSFPTAAICHSRPLSHPIKEYCSLSPPARGQRPV